MTPRRFRREHKMRLPWGQIPRPLPVHRTCPLCLVYRCQYRCRYRCHQLRWFFLGEAEIPMRPHRPRRRPPPHRFFQGTPQPSPHFSVGAERHGLPKRRRHHMKLPQRLRRSRRTTASAASSSQDATREPWSCPRVCSRFCTREGDRDSCELQSRGRPAGRSCSADCRSKGRRSETEDLVELEGGERARPACASASCLSWLTQTASRLLGAACVHR